MKAKASTVKADADLARWCEVLASVRAPVEPVPAGWLTATQISAKQFQPRQTIEPKLRALARDGKIAAQKFRIQSGKVIRRVTHYRIK